MSAPLRLCFSALGNTLLIWALALTMPESLSVTGGMAAYVIVGSLLTLMNLIVRPLLRILAFPFRLLFSSLATIGVQLLFLAAAIAITQHMDPAIVTVSLSHTIRSWLTVSVALGLWNGVMNVLLRS